MHHPLKAPSCSFAVTPSFSFQPQATTDLLSVSTVLCFTEFHINGIIQYLCVSGFLNNIVSSCFHLAWCFWDSSTLVHIIVAPFYYWGVFHQVDIHLLFIYSTVDRPLNGFQFGAIMNIASGNMCVQVLCGHSISLAGWGKLSRSRIAGLPDKCVFNSLRNYQTVFQSGNTLLHIHQQCIRVLVSPHPCQHLVISVFTVLGNLLDV